MTLNEIQILYLHHSGLSTRQIAPIVHLSKSTVALVVRGRRSRSEACAIRRPSRSSHWRTCRSVARKTWTRLHGPIPKKWEVHHINEDYTDNSPENLECLPHEEHQRKHRSVFGSKK
jgi:transposase